MSRGQQDFDAALRDALRIRATYYELLRRLESWEHLRFEAAQDHADLLLKNLDGHLLRKRMDALVGACVCEHYSRLPANT